MYASVAGVPLKKGNGLIQTWNCYLILILYFFSLWLVMIGMVQIVFLLFESILFESILFESNIVQVISSSDSIIL